MSRITDGELLAFLDEQLAAPRASIIEQELRESPALRQRAALLSRWRDQGGHSIGEIWRRNRVSCPSRAELAEYAAGRTDAETRRDLQIHIEECGCALCAANLADIAGTPAADSAVRQHRFFESSAGALRSQPSSRSRVDSHPTAGE